MGRKQEDLNMKYLVDENVVSEQEFWSEFDNAIENYVDANLDDLIDQENDEVSIGSLTYSASDVLKNVDPIAYRCYSSDLVEYFYSDFKYELERYDEVDIDGTTFIIKDNDEEDE